MKLIEIQSYGKLWQNNNFSFTFTLRIGTNDDSLCDTQTLTDKILLLHTVNKKISSLFLLFSSSSSLFITLYFFSIHYYVSLSIVAFAVCKKIDSWIHKVNNIQCEHCKQTLTTSIRLVILLFFPILFFIQLQLQFENFTTEWNQIQMGYLFLIHLNTLPTFLRFFEIEFEWRTTKNITLGITRGIVVLLR